MWRDFGGGQVDCERKDSFHDHSFYSSQSLRFLDEINSYNLNLHVENEYYLTVTVTVATKTP
jgi:hypothetical protein